MLLKISEKDGHVLVKVTRDIMMSNSMEFSEEFEKVNALSPETLAIDLGDVQFVDSSGIGILINLVTEIREKGTEISVFNMHKSLFSVFKLSGMQNIMELYKTSEEFYEKFPRWKTQE